MREHWTLGTLVGLPVVAIVVIICLALIFGGLMFRREDEELGWTVIVIGAAALLVTLVGTGIAYWPWFSSDHHKWKPKSGVVASVDKRLLTAGEGLNEAVAVRFNNDPNTYRCDDTRCITLKPGESLTLMCKKDWQYAAEDGWSCRFGKRS